MSFYKSIPLLMMCFLFTGCGFTPLYHAPCEGSDVSYPIKIATIEDRQGQILRNYLVDLLTPEGTPLKPKYTLEIKLKDIIRDTGIKKDETTTRKKATLTAHLVLKDSCHKIVYSHTVSAINSFTVLTENYYSDLVAAEYGRKEALRLLSEKIKLTLSAYFDSHPEK